MPCSCPTNTLRLFIRSVAHVDLPSSTIRTTHPQWQKTAIRSFSSGLRQPRSKSDDTAIPFEKSWLDTPKAEFGTKSWAQGVVDGRISLRKEQVNSAQQTGDGQAKGESHSVEGTEELQGGLSKIENRKVRKDRRREKPPTAEIKPIIREIGRKKEAYSSGFKIHYSAPPAPVSARQTKQGNEAKVQSSDSTKEKESKIKSSYLAKEKEDEEWTPPPREHWQIDKEALKAKFPEGWNPLKRLSPDALAGIRALHAQDPAQYTTKVLANSFEVSPEAMRRILKSKWSPDAEEESDRRRRWQNRGKSVYTRYVELGVLKPPKQWRDMGIGKGRPEWMVKKQAERKEWKERAESSQASLPALITMGRARDVKYGPGSKARREKAPLPALITTRRVEAAVRREESLEDIIL